MGKVPNYPEEFRRRAVELYKSSGRPLSQVARELGVSETGLRNWVIAAEVETGEREGLTGAERKELVELRRDKRRLEMENEILRRAAAYFAKENVLPK